MDNDDGEILWNRRGRCKNGRRNTKGLAKEEEDALLVVKQLQLAHTNVEEKIRKKAQGEAAMYKGTARTYFDCSCWEVQQRRTVTVDEGISAGDHQDATAWKVIETMIPRQFMFTTK